MKRKAIVMTVLVGVILHFTLIGCDTGNEPSGGGTRDPVTYTGTANSVTYTLKIEDGGARSVLTPTQGDKYTLTASGKTSTGAVNSFTIGVLTLAPSNASSTTFTTTVSGNGITAMSGTITWNNGTTDPAPTTFTGGGGNGGSLVVDMTNITTFLAGYGLTEADIKPTDMVSAIYKKHAYDANTAEISYEKQMTRQELFDWAIKCMKAMQRAADNGKVYSLNTNNGSLAEIDPDVLSLDDINTGSALIVSLMEYLVFYRQGQRTYVNLIYTEIPMVSLYDVTIQIGPY